MNNQDEDMEIEEEDCDKKKHKKDYQGMYNELLIRYMTLNEKIERLKKENRMYERILDSIHVVSGLDKF